MCSLCMTEECGCLTGLLVICCPTTRGRTKSTQAGWEYRAVCRGWTGGVGSLAVIAVLRPHSLFHWCCCRPLALQLDSTVINTEWAPSTPPTGFPTGTVPHSWEHTEGAQCSSFEACVIIWAGVQRSDWLTVTSSRYDDRKAYGNVFFFSFFVQGFFFFKFLV